MKNQNQKGAAVLIFVAITTIIAVMLMFVATTQSLSALRRSKAASDGIVSTYNAEYWVNDMFSRMTLDYDVSSYDDLEIDLADGAKVKIDILNDAGSQTVTAIAKRLNATSKIEGTRTENATGGQVDIVLGLDCTGSMNYTFNGGANCVDQDPCISRFEAQEEAALNFIDNLIAHPNSESFRLGVEILGLNAVWLKNESGEDITPLKDLSLNEIRNIIETSFGEVRFLSDNNINNPNDYSIACSTTGFVSEGTNVGAGFALANNYFADPYYDDNPEIKKIEIVITDGEPNARIKDDNCEPSVWCPYEGNYNFVCGNVYYKSLFGTCITPKEYCRDYALDYLACTLESKNDTYGPLIINFLAPQVPPVNYPPRPGTRDPDVEAFGVTILQNPPGDVVDIFRNSIGENNYFNADESHELSSFLDTIFNNISQFSNLEFQRLIPLP